MAMLIGAIILLGPSSAFDEPAVVPTELATWAAQLYLVIPGSVGLFRLLFYLLSHRCSPTSSVMPGKEAA